VIEAAALSTLGVYAVFPLKMAMGRTNDAPSDIGAEEVIAGQSSLVDTDPATAGDMSTGDGADPAVASSQPEFTSLPDLDSTLFFYQHPQTGTISSYPMTIRQLCRLFCPVREGMVPILAPHTRCVQIHLKNQITTTEEQSEEQGEAQPHYSYGEWKMATEIPVLQEASCVQWYASTRPPPTTTEPSPPQTTQGPVSCRTLINLYDPLASDTQQQQNSPVLVFAQNLTSEWTDIQNVPNLQLALQALSNISNDYSTTLSGELPTPEDPNESTTTAKGTENDASLVEHQRSAADQEVQDELEAFLSSTASTQNHKGADDDDDDDHNDAAYESDGGTKYVKDPFTGNWIHEALAPPRPEKNKNVEPLAAATAKKQNGTDKKATTISSSNTKKNQKARFAKRNAKCWIYVMGLPITTTEKAGVTEAEVAQYFSKAGLLDLNPETLQPKVKLYRDTTTGQLKGDASICYARPESVELALSILDESLWDASHTLKVQRATFQAKRNEDEVTGGQTPKEDKGDDDKSNSNPTKKIQPTQPNYRKRKQVSEAQRKVARLALLQAQDEGFGERLSGGRKGLRIIVIQHMVDDVDENRLQDEIQRHCERFGPIEKVTLISEQRIVIVKYVEPAAARDAVQALHGQPSSSTPTANNGKAPSVMHVTYWDGVTDYATPTNQNSEQALKEEQERHEDFGAWLDDQAQELPPELQLQMEGQ
jgi:hypothetical protein